MKLEPATWSYSGLRNTLEDMNRWEDAYSVIQKGHQLFPKEPNFNDHNVAELPPLPEANRHELYKQMVKLREFHIDIPQNEGVLSYDENKKKDFCTAHNITENQFYTINDEGVYKHW